uniref:Glycosyltransferase n=1 Tax=Cicer arietinum TaxID=3827 RepID=A0A1S2XT48_CICAR|nr:UDP-glycosyltransferase 73C6-like isoform X2 [Cicer arietinum]XP_004494097.1 UDP-glycosyltransferase 73C6-like isoform X1 [Cicer arietinum]
MESEAPKHVHFVLFPLMSPGHMLPMIDIAKTLTQHKNIIVTIVTTPHNASRFSHIFSQNLRLLQLQFPSQDHGFPQGCENFDMLPSMSMAYTFFTVSNTLLQQQAQQAFQNLTPKPNCIISDFSFPYTSQIAAKFNIPRISFYGVSCFCLVWHKNLLISNVMENIEKDSESFFIPEIPHKIEITKAQYPSSNDGNWKEFVGKMVEAEMGSYGVVVNSFEELEQEYVSDYKKSMNDKVWCVGPVSLRNNSNNLDMAKRGNNNNKDSNSIDCLKWLDLQKPNSVIYVCFGSICNLNALQFIELGMGLEACEKPFIWVIRERNQTEELNKWFDESGFEERIKGKGILIKGWAPQVLILSHCSVGGFLTHCGWNSTLEAICSGVPMITWPLFGDQFFNERFVVEILRVGVMVGVVSPVNWGEEENVGVLVKKEHVLRAIEKLMDEGNYESEERRKRAKELAKMAKKSVEEGGSSHFNVNLLIQDILQHSNKGD